MEAAMGGGGGEPEQLPEMVMALGAIIPDYGAVAAAAIAQEVAERGLLPPAAAPVKLEARSEDVANGA
jgi:hypothetical protein